MSTMKNMQRGKRGNGSRLNKNQRSRVSIDRVPRSIAAKAIEMKFVDIQHATNLYATNTFAVTLLNGIAQGAGASQRVGSRVSIRDVELRMNLRLAPTTTGSGSLRTMLVWDRQPNASTAAATDVLSFDDVTSPINPTNDLRFVVLYDETVALGTAGPLSAWKQCRVNCNLPSQYLVGSAGGTITSIATGALLLLTDAAVGFSVAQCLNQGTTRVWFEDA